ncbi:uncharacterized protein LOC129570656 [Sitodiplosis mosellana]|uniref:uncharacterized protein LOC129570656 n=1 Tax=Sitodiplosis mosellana TaxID=263140 RepID=UPI002443DFBD|nr:uncharacterized protein LOC129570656 [Sitodiplosis mosellana]
MAIQCGLCKNVMPSSSFLSHKERKHSMEQRVPYVKLPDDVLKSDTANGKLIKCRHCPNRIPEHAMERHLQRSHVKCHLCGKILQKFNYDQHMQQKHGTNLVATSSLSQSKSSIQSDSDLASTMGSTRDPSPIPYRPPPPQTSGKPLMPSPSKTNNKSDVIRVNEWELHKYIRQGRVYTKNGCLYLRNVDLF